MKSMAKVWTAIANATRDALNEWTDGRADLYMDETIEARFDLDRKIRDIILYHMAITELGSDAPDEAINKRIDEIEHEWAWG